VTRILRQPLGDVTVLYTAFEGTTVDPSGKSVEARFKAIEVFRRQPDGAWKLIFGDPRGGEREGPEGHFMDHPICDQRKYPTATCPG
jgi:hypothetical protein